MEIMGCNNCGTNQLLLSLEQLSDIWQGILLIGLFSLFTKNNNHIVLHCVNEVRPVITFHKPDRLNLQGVSRELKKVSTLEDM